MGRVYLVGAGRGDAGLSTVKALCVVESQPGAMPAGHLEHAVSGIGKAVRLHGRLPCADVAGEPLA